MNQSPTPAASGGGKTPVVTDQSKLSLQTPLMVPRVSRISVLKFRCAVQRAGIMSIFWSC